MEIKAETKWLCEHAHSLEKYSGQCVVFNVQEGIVSSGGSLPKFFKSTRRIGEHEKPFVFHVPSKKELVEPLIVARKK